MKTLKLIDRDACCGENSPGSKPLGEAEPDKTNGEVKFNLYGEEVIHKTVTASGSCGRVYLPLAWVGKKVKIIRVN